MAVCYRDRLFFHKRLGIYYLVDNCISSLMLVKMTGCLLCRLTLFQGEIRL